MCSCPIPSFDWDRQSCLSHVRSWTSTERYIWAPLFPTRAIPTTIRRICSLPNTVFWLRAPSLVRYTVSSSYQPQRCQTCVSAKKKTAHDSHNTPNRSKSVTIHGIKAPGPWLSKTRIKSAQTVVACRTTHSPSFSPT
jgi:hypothetical protein